MAGRIGVGLAAALVAGIAAWTWRPRSEAESVIPTMEVQPGPLTISFSQDGSIQSRDRVVVRCEVEGRSTIISLIEEGRYVRKDEVLVELDSSRHEESRVEQQLRVEASESAWIQARENLDIVRNQSETDIAEAKLAVKFSCLEQEKFEKGEYQQQLQQADAEISIAREELRRAQDKVAWSRKLSDQGFLTRLEMEADELAARRRDLDLQLALGKKDVLTRYTYSMTREKLASDIRKAEMALVRIERKATSDTVRSETDLRTKESEYMRQKQRLDRILEMIRKCRICAPADGMVVYASTVQGRRWDRDPLGAGMEVVERQELIYLPARAEMMATIQIPEASLPKITTGLTARIRVDALPDREFSGHLERISILPNASQSWLNPDLKVYDADVFLDGADPALRPGMSCQVELFIDHYDSALAVPVQCVVREKNVPKVYVLNRGVPVARVVRTGLDNNRMVHILDGLRSGDRVLMAPPLPDSTAESLPPAVRMPAKQGNKAGPPPTAKTPGPGVK